jgi:xanthine/CO dehydrogenase XdhC/CoxF family maturation factor
MAELRDILGLWKRAAADGEEICLATVVGVEGSAYRRPGARMLLTSGGGRAGTISGGCLEAEVVKKAWWLTEKGASMQRYSSFFDDDGDMPWGLGCGGTVLVLLERGPAAMAVLEALRRCEEERSGSAIATRTDGESVGTALILNDLGEPVFAADADEQERVLGAEALASRSSQQAGGLFVEYAAAPLALCIFGAGDDARPLVEFAAALGWQVTVADGRTNLLRAERFPGAARVVGSEEALAALRPEDAVVVMTHSYEQDRGLLRTLLPMGLKYLGMLGPRARTERLAGEAGPAAGLTAEECLARVHAPVGLDLGGHAPAPIALSIAAEIQAVLAGREPRRTEKAQPSHA